MGSIGSLFPCIHRSPGVSTNGVAELLLVGGAEIVKREPEDLTRKSISPSERFVVDRRRMVLLPSSITTTTATSGASSARLDPHTKEVLEAQIIKEEVEAGERPRLSQATYTTTTTVDDKMSTAGYLGFSSASPGPNYEQVSYLSPSPVPYTSAGSQVHRGGTPGGFPIVTEPYAGEYYNAYRPHNESQYASGPRPVEYSTGQEAAFERNYLRSAVNCKTVPLTVDSSPDSGTSSDPGRDHGLFQTQVSALFY